jgi:MFS family permease
MAYDDSRFRGESAFRAEPDYRTEDGAADTPTSGATSSYPTGTHSANRNAYSGHGERTDGVAAPGYGPTDLDNVFDDPTHGEPGQDRLGVHLIWELVLLVGVAGVGYLLYHDHRSTVTGDGLRALMISAAALGLLVLGVGLSLRAASPNLAAGAIAAASGVYLAEHARGGLLSAAVQAVLLALVVGAVIGLLVVGLHVPSWAASFGAGLAVVVWIQQHHAVLRLPQGAYQPLPDASYWLGGLALLSLVGGILGSVKSVRRAVGRFRPVGDPAYRRGGVAAAVSVAALVGSSVLAAGSGELMALRAGQVPPVDTSLTLIGLAFGGALLAGSSAFGRRGGLLGGVLAATLLTLVIRYLEVTDRRVSQLATAAVAIGVGLVVTRLVESYGRPRGTASREVEQWRIISPTLASDPPPDNGGWSGSRATGWTSPLPASSADDSWGGDDIWTGR